MYYLQKINSAAHVSFSVFGLGFIAAFGILVISVSLSLESVVAFVQKRLKKTHTNPFSGVPTGYYNFSAWHMND